MATKKQLDPKMTCRGKWSVCGGTEPSISAKWHLGADCTKKRAEAMKKAAAEIKPPKAKAEPKPKAAAAPVRKTPPAPKREPVARVTALAAPVPAVRETTAKG